MKNWVFIFLNLVGLLTYVPPVAFADTQNLTNPALVVCEEQLKPQLVQHAAGLEFEVDLDDHALKTLTTEDGTLNSFLKHYPPRVFAKIDSLDGTQKWENLPSQLQRDLLTAAVKYNVSKTRTHSTSIRGIKAKSPSIVDVHNRSYHDTERIHGIELLFESSKPVGEALLETTRLVHQLGYKLRGTQVHTPFLFERFVTNYGTHAARIVGERYRQLNLFSEALSVVEGYNISDVTSQLRGVRTELFSYLTQFKFEEVLSYLKALAQGQSLPTIDTKMSFVGFRPRGKYRNPNFVGFEYRSIPINAHLNEISKVLNALSDELQKGQVHFNVTRFNYWFADQTSRGRSQTQSWYNSESTDRDQILKSAPAGIRAMLLSDPQEKILSEVFTRLDSNVAILMLLNDWSQDFLFFENKNAQELILKEQLRALQRLGKENTNLVLKDFVMNSRLLHRVYQSIVHPQS